MSRGSIFPAGNGVFAYDCFDSTRACTYDQLRTLLNDDLGGVDSATRVAIAMRNGADLALALLRVMHWAIAVPLCPNTAPAELRTAMEGCAYCVVDATDGPAAAAAAAAGAEVVLAAPKEGEAGATFRIAAEAVRRPPMRAFSLRRMFSSSRMLSARSMSALPPCLVLRTSGTTGQPKLVYKTQQQLSRGGAIIAKTLALEPSDCFLLCGKK